MPSTRFLQARSDLTAAHAKETQEEVNWLPDMDLNHDKQIQSLLCYRYTIGQAETT